MPKERSLKAALDRYTGRDYKQEKREKSQKIATKRKHSRTQVNAQDKALDDAGGVALDAARIEAQHVAAEVERDNAESEEDDSEDDEEEGGALDIANLVDSDSDSDDEDEDDDIGEEHKSNGLSTGTAPTTLASQLSSLVNGTSKATIQRPENEKYNDEDNESIALSDISADPNEETDLIPHQRLTINNTAALTRALKSFALPYASLSFSEHQSITTPDPVTIPDINDDVELEKALYAQSLSAALTGRKNLKAEGVPFTRPTDYFAEMVKSDEHMGKIKARLLDDAQAKKASSDAKLQRQKKKFGKLEQQERLQARAKEKREMLDKTKVLKRKRAGAGVEEDREEQMFDVAAEEAAEEDQRDRRDKRRGKDGEPGAKRQRKNEKFGFGGKKRGLKRGDAQSSGDMSGFSTKRMKGQVAGGRGGKKRLGKSRRQSTK